MSDDREVYLGNGLWSPSGDAEMARIADQTYWQLLAAMASAKEK